MELPSTFGDTTRTILLGLLAAGDNHGYGLRKELEGMRAEGWAGVKPGSLHAMLHRLEREGLVQAVSRERSGKRPTRTVYRLTRAGRKSLDQLLAAAWSVPAHVVDPLDTALVMVRLLPPGDVIALLEERTTQVESALQRLDDAWQYVNNDDPGTQEMVADLFEHRRRLLQTDLAWSRHLAGRVKAGVYGSFRRSRLKGGAG